MKPLKIGYSQAAAGLFSTNRMLMPAEGTDFTDIAAAVVTDSDTDIINNIFETCFGIPVFVFSNDADSIESSFKERIYRLVNQRSYSPSIINNEIEVAAVQYEERMLPFF